MNDSPGINNKNYIPLTLCAAAARTSASQSLSKLWNAGTKSFFVISGPTAFCNYVKKTKSVNEKLGFFIETTNPFFELLEFSFNTIGKCICRPR